MQPRYEYGEEVRLIRNVRNDGTYPGKEVGELLIRRGAIGCVYDVGTYLQDQLIYRVHFLNEGMTVGCREEELIPLDEEWIQNRFEFREKVVSIMTLSVAGNTIAEKGQTGEVQKVVREPGRISYHVRFGERTFLIPEQALDAPEEAEEQTDTVPAVESQAAGESHG